jgi:hypothetical protein
MNLEPAIEMNRETRETRENSARDRLSLATHPFTRQVTAPSCAPDGPCAHFADFAGSTAVPRMKTISSGMRHLCVLLLLGSLLVGCLSRPPLEIQSFALVAPDLERPPHPRMPTAQITLRRTRISPLFEDAHLIYRTGEHRYERDPYARWLVAPERQIPRMVEAALRRGGGLDVADETGRHNAAERWLEIEVTALYGDFRPGQTPAAVTGLYCRLTDGRTGAWLLDREYVRRSDLKARTAEAVADGLNLALAAALETAAGDLRGAVVKGTSSE